MNQKFTITRQGMEKNRELKSKPDYLQEYFIRVMNRKNDPQNHEKMVGLKGPRIVSWVWKSVLGSQRIYS